MTTATKALSQMKKASKLTNRAFRKNGPKSYKKGQGALLKVLHVSGGQASSRELVERLSFDRGELKNVVRKAERNGYVTIEDAEEKRTYTVKLTEEGEKIAERRCAANSKTAEEILSCLTDEEIDQLNAITEKIIVSCKEHGAHGKRKSGRKHRRSRRARR
ncbi:MarR family winged helix-turn-helix transcriptional regulator [Adlercreutzia sp. ZJ473]|uniref:MarR family winged helix-turn-helix transcriptional regulator n=1 Tax=Adlercreutzia sp. ZJ473 TaxID=2722822 RepID=UPI0015550A36|nr:winged helix DNA-binding protein [Adlercreutzia sp. ZJ473]